MDPQAACQWQSSNPTGPGHLCRLVAARVPANVLPVVQEKSCLYCQEKFPDRTENNPGEVVASAARFHAIKAGIHPRKRPLCGLLGKPILRQGSPCQWIYNCNAGHGAEGKAQPCIHCQTCNHWVPITDEDGLQDQRQVWVAGYPSPCGGADTELHHQVLLWRSKGLQVCLVPLRGEPNPKTRKEMDAIGCHTVPYSPGIFAGKVVVGFCSRPFLDLLPKMATEGKPARTVWANCMTWTTPQEAAAYQAGWIDVSLFQTDHQRVKLQPYFAASGPVRTLPYIPHFCAEAFMAARSKPSGYFGIGRISRADPFKYDARLWTMLGAVQAPTPVKAFILGYGDKVAEKCGKPLAGLDWLTWAPGGTSALDFYTRTHAVMHYTGGSGENLPRVLLEAWAAGSVFLGEDAYAFRELTRHGENALLCRSPEEMAVWATRVAFDPDLRAKLVAGGYAALERYNAENSWRTWEQILFGQLNP